MEKMSGLELAAQPIEGLFGSNTGGQVLMGNENLEADSSAWCLSALAG